MELDGLKVLRVEHSGNIGTDVKEMTSDDKRKRILELMEVARERKESRGDEKPN